MSQGRTINKFFCKAKSYDKAEWIGGYPSFQEVIQKNEKNEDIVSFHPFITNFTDEGLVPIYVIPETICRVVPGVADMDHNPIFSGDILEEVVDKKSLTTDDKGNKVRRIYRPNKVEVKEVPAGFLFLLDADYLPMSNRIISVDIISSNYRVVGNKYDNVEIIGDDSEDTESDSDNNVDDTSSPEEAPSEEVSESDDFLSKLNKLRPGEVLELPGTKGDLRLEVDEEGNYHDVEETN